MKVTILGARGSIPVSGKKYTDYGGATSCVMVEEAGQVILFDAGSGLMNLERDIWKGKTIHLFFSHYHLDHMLGITMSPMLFDKEAKLVLHAPMQLGDISLAIGQLLQRPIWPIGPESFLADVRYEMMNKQPVNIGGVTIESCMMEHPGTACSYRLCYDGKQMVYATDCELSENWMSQNANWLKNSTLVIMDGQYTKEDYIRCKGFGHTSMDITARFLHELGVENGCIFHHAPAHEDDFLHMQEKRLQAMYPGISFAWEGEVIQL